jgi:hypothetical protein
MTSRVHALAPWTVLGLVAAAGLAWLGLLGFVWTDYEREAAPALAALVRGDVGDFLSLSPAYGGSLIIRAPFALAASSLGGGDLAVFRAVAVPCLLAGVCLGVVLAAQLAARGRGRAECAVVLLLCAGNPITLRALDIGHPEELFGGVLCVGAVLAALRGRGNLAAVLLGLALANKAWALLAVGPVLLALPDRRARTLAIAGAIAGVIMLPLLLAGAPAAHPGAAVETGTIFQPWQVWWALGSPDHVIVGTDNVVKEGYRLAPAWVSPLSHPLIVAVALPLSLLAWRRRGDPLLLLSLLFLLRCVLDPWNTSYYVLPAILAVVAWEALRFDRGPVVALGLTAATWATWEWLVAAASPDVQSLVYLGWSLPLAAGLAWKLYAPSVPALGRATDAVSSGGRTSVWSTTQ